MAASALIILRCETCVGSLDVAVMCIPAVLHAITNLTKIGTGNILTGFLGSLSLEFSVLYGVRPPRTKLLHRTPVLLSTRNFQNSMA